MIITLKEAQALSDPGYKYIIQTNWSVISVIIQEVERRTIDAERDAICNRLDDFLHPIIYGEGNL